MVKSPHDILETYWGYESFRPLQLEIIESVLNGRDTVALLHTGGGKSVCFQVPALVMEGICIVVSPLVALMTDQVQALMDKGIKALHLSGGLTSEELTTRLDNALFGNYKFLYLSPERLQQEQVQNALKKMNINLIAVDEAHCISQWGNDFRPAYQNIHILKELHPYVATIALTATATQEVLADTVHQLKLEEPQVFKKSFARTNLSYEVNFQEDKEYTLIERLKNLRGSAIVYVRSRKLAENYSKSLDLKGISADYFHGGLPTKAKNNKLQAWLAGRTQVMVATNAFGMGIDNPHVRYVIHVQLPDSLESYFQEAGRAGRDGQEATALLLYNEYDKTLLRKQFIDTLPSVADIKSLYRTLSNYFQISYGEGEFSEHRFNFNQFCTTYELNPIIAYNGIQTLDRLGIVRLSQQFGRNTKMRFLVSSEKLLDLFDAKPALSIVGKTFLRLYGGLFETLQSVNLDWAAKKTGISIEKIIGALQEMERLDVLELQLFETDASLTFLVPREDERTINPFARLIEELNTKKQQQVAAVLRYVENDKECKEVQLLRYFGEKDAADCGHCSVCKKKWRGDMQTDRQQMAARIQALLKEGPMDSRQLLESLTFAEADLLRMLKWLLDRKKIALNAINEYYWIE